MVSKGKGQRAEGRFSFLFLFARVSKRFDWAYEQRTLIPR